MENEIWKDVLGYEGLYIISNKGYVKSVKRNENLAICKMKIGYYCVRLWKSNVTKLWTMHRLLAIHFIENPMSKREVNHIDGDKGNYNLNNLEWSTPSENMKHSVATGLNNSSFKGGSLHSQRKLSIQDISAIRELRVSGLKLKELGIRFNITPDHVCRVVRHKQTIENEIFAK